MSSATPSIEPIIAPIADGERWDGSDLSWEPPVPVGGALERVSVVAVVKVLVIGKAPSLVRVCVMVIASMEVGIKGV